MKINFCNCSFVLILFKEYGNLLKEYIETFQCAPTSAPMRSELCAMQLTRHVRLVSIRDMDSRMYFFSQYQLRKKKNTNHSQKKMRNQRRRGRTFHPFSILPVDFPPYSLVASSGLKLLVTGESQKNRCIRPRRTRAVRMFVAKYGREISFPRRGRINIFPAKRSPRYVRRSGLSTGLEIISASSSKRRKIFLSGETSLRLYRPVTDMHAFVRVYIERVRTHGWTAKLPPEVGVGIHLIDDVTLREWSRGGC